MTTSLIDADSLLAIDIGQTITRALLFDVVDGRYRFLAAGSGPTTIGAPYKDAAEGVRLAIDHLQAITGRVLVGKDERLIIPSLSNGTGIDTLVVTLSTGDPLRVVAVGLLEDVSVESAQRLASTTYARVVDKISLNDRRKMSGKIDAVLHARPDLIIVAGGTEGGASQSVMSLLESVGIACYLIPKEQRPDLLFVGNKDLASRVETEMGGLTHLAVAPNVRPTLDLEQLGPAQAELSQIYRSVNLRKIPGIAELDEWSGGKLMPTSAAFGRMIRFLSQILDPSKGVLGVELGASATTMAASFGGNLAMGIYPQLGLGKNLPGLLEECSLESICGWLPFEISPSVVQDYIYNKAIYPSHIPGSKEELDIEQAIARQALRTAVSKISTSFPSKVFRNGNDLLPWFEPIVAAGSLLTRAPTAAQSLMILLDGLQPTGVTTLWLDHNNILPSLGAAASVNSILPIQVLDANALLNLGTVISPVGNARYGAPVLRVKVSQEEGGESSLDVKYGSIEVIPLPVGKPANLQLQPLNRFDVGMGGPGRGGSVRVKGGALGVIIDARGRPLRLPDEIDRRVELYKKWYWIFGE